LQCLSYPDFYLPGRILTSSALAHSNFAPLVDVVKDGSKNNVQHSQQQVHGMQPQLQQQQQSSLRLPQQVFTYTSLSII